MRVKECHVLHDNSSSPTHPLTHSPTPTHTHSPTHTGPYEYIRRAVSHVGPDGKPLRTMPSSIAAGGLTGICYWLSCYPIDVIKNRIQAAPDRTPPVYRGMGDAARAIYGEAGVRGFFRGFVPCILRAFPANASCFVAFELAMRYLPIQ